MAVEVVLPKVDMDMETGVIAQWKVAEGARVRAGDILFDMETAKSVMEVEAPASGVIRGLAPIDGEALAVGTVVAMIDDGDDAVRAPATTTHEAPGEAGTTDEARQAPGTAHDGAHAPGTAHEAGQAPGTTHDAAHAPGTTAASSVPGVAPRVLHTAGAGELRATPYARSLARAHGVDLFAVPGTGPRGRIRGDDVQVHLGTRPANAAAGPAGRAMASGDGALRANATVRGDAAVNEDHAAEHERLIPFSPTRRLAAKRLAESVQRIPHFYLTAHIDMGALRAAVTHAARAIRRQSGAVPTPTVALAQICARTLAAHPLLNASVEGDATRTYERVHIGVAMDRDGDLLVPVLRDAHERTLGELAAEFRRLRDAVRSRTITPADLRGATFTLSSLELYGVDAYTAIINPPQSAILAIGRTQDVPVGRDGAVVLRPMATLTLSSDHRIVDGVTAARFMADLRRAIESPAALA